MAGRPEPLGTVGRGTPSVVVAPSPPHGGSIDPFGGPEAIGMVAATPTVRGQVDPGAALVFEATLQAADPFCAQPEDGRCPAGCFHLVAVALDPGPSDLVVRVSPPDDPEDVI